ncbi:MAG: efflux RND transporter periplasmic adaptor subunit [Hylemonella sp.]
MNRLFARLGGRARWFVLAAVLGLAAAALALAWRATAAPAYTVQPAALVRTLQFSARVAALTRVEVGSTLTGRVERVAVREGDTVQRGQLLVLLETDELRAAQAQALAGERQAQATVQAAQATLARTEQLVRQNYTSAAQLDEARRALDVAQAQLGAARAAVQVAQARLAQARIVAPAPARVLARSVEPGQIVQPGKPLLTLALHGPTELVAPVDERFLDQLQVGQPAAVVADAYPAQRLAARVLRIAPLVDAQRGAVEVRLALQQEPPAFLREDMTLSVEVETARREQALALPLALLHAVQGDRARVWVVADGVAQERTVRLGLRTLQAAEVLEGLRAGEQVLAGAAWQAGQRVRPLPWAGGQEAAAAGSGGAGAAALSNAMGR